MHLNLSICRFDARTCRVTPGQRKGKPNQDVRSGCHCWRYCLIDWRATSCLPLHGLGHWAGAYNLACPEPYRKRRGCLSRWYANRWALFIAEIMKVAGLNICDLKGTLVQKTLISLLTLKNRPIYPIAMNITGTIVPKRCVDIVESKDRSWDYLHRILTGSIGWIAS